MLKALSEIFYVESDWLGGEGANVRWYNVYGTSWTSNDVETFKLCL